MLLRSPPNPFFCVLEFTTKGDAVERGIGCMGFFDGFLFYFGEAQRALETAFLKSEKCTSNMSFDVSLS